VILPATVTQQRGVLGTFFSYPAAPRLQDGIRLLESVKKATDIRAIRDTVRLECDKREAQLEREPAQIISRCPTRILSGVAKSTNRDDPVLQKE